MKAKCSATLPVRKLATPRRRLRASLPWSHPAGDTPRPPERLRNASPSTPPARGAAAMLGPVPARRLHLRVLARCCPVPERLWQECFRELGSELADFYHYQPSAITPALRPRRHRRGMPAARPGRGRGRYHSALLVVRDVRASADALRRLLERLGYEPGCFCVCVC